MNENNLKKLVAQGLSAMQAGSDDPAKATDEINNDARHPALRSALEEGNRTFRQWADRIRRAAEQAGPADQQDNPVLEAHYEVSRRIREAAPDDASRDLGIIASGQLALHYWIASFGTMANYCRQTGMDDAARDMKACADEAKQADEKHSQLAEQLLSEG